MVTGRKPTGRAARARPAPKRRVPAASKDMLPSRAIGTRLRTAREAAGISVRELARRIGVSPSLISQVELDQSMPSVGTLFLIANELGLVVDDLFRDQGLHVQEAGAAQNLRSPHLRPQERMAIRLAARVKWERLTANPDPEVEFLHVVYEVGGASCEDDQMVRHGGKEFAYLLSGRLGVRIGFDEYLLEAGDSISFDAQTPHRLWNAGDEPAVAIWTVIRRSGDRRQLGAIHAAPRAAASSRRARATKAKGILHES